MRDGNDAGPGTIDAPIRTLLELHRRTYGRVLRGDLIVELHGDFDETLHLDMSGDDGVVVTVAGGTPRARRDHMRRVRRFMRDFFRSRSKLSARDYPEPPSAVKSVMVDIKGGVRGVFKSLRFGAKK